MEGGVLYFVARGKVYNDHRYEIRSGNKYNQLTTSRRPIQKRTKDQLLKGAIYLLMDVPETLSLYGQDNNGGVWSMCKMNMILHGIASADIQNDDKAFTRSLMMVARATGISFFDHIIIEDNRYFSFADEGLVEEYELKAIREL